jgi:hypothetical protein
MMFDIYGYPHSTVGDYDVHPAWTEYYATWKKWLKSLSSHDYQMMLVKDAVDKENDKIGQLTLPIFDNYKEPRPAVPCSILKKRD